MQTGEVHCGTLLSDDGFMVMLDTPELGKMKYYKSAMLRMVDAEPGTTVKNAVGIDRQDRYLDADRALQSTRYLFAPSAHTLRQGEGYWNLSPIGGNITYAISDNTMAGLSASWLGYGFNFKQALEVREDLKVSFGALMQAGWAGTNTTDTTSLVEGAGRLFFPFLNITKGNENNNFTLGFGYLSGERVIGDFVSVIRPDVVEEINSPMLNASGCFKVGDKAWFVTENYYFFNPEFFPVNMVLSFGLRRWSDSWKWTNELAFMVLVEENGNLRPLPWVSLTRPF